MVEVFDQHKVSFSSVTQQINSATSMGRLMLNVLLSFAQFEREVTGERIRDKIAASKRKGMWMGGPVPLGYRVESRQLVVVPEEAQLVRQIFASFISSRSTTKLVKQLAEQGAQSKNGKTLSKQTIYKILHNRMYLGELGRKGEYFRGQHEALIDQSTWDQVQAIMSESSRDRARDTWGQKCQYGFLLRGMVFTIDGDLYLPMATRKPSGKVYRYYVVNKNQNMGAGTVAFSNLPAGEMEKAVMEQILEILRSGQMVHQYWKQISVINPELSEPEAMVLFFKNTATIWNKLATQAKQDIVRTLIKRVTVTPDGIDLQWRYEAWGSLMGTPPRNSVGSELLELEAA